MTDNPGMAGRAVTRIVRPKYQVFVSATFADLHDERQAVTWEILKAGHIPVGMENFSAEPDRGWKVINRTLETTDYYILIIAGRYGTIDEALGISWTEREYRRAMELSIPVLAFVRDKKFISGDQMDTDEKAKKLAGLIADINKTWLRESWTTSDDLRARISLALLKRISEDEADACPRPGWYRGSQLPSPATMDEMGKLSAENRALREEIQRSKVSAQAQSSAKKQLWLGELTELKQTLKEGMKQARAIYPPYHTRTQIGMTRDDVLDVIAANLTIPDDEFRGWVNEFVRITHVYARDWFAAGASSKDPVYREVKAEVREKEFREGPGKDHITSLEDLYSKISTRIDELLS